MVFPYLRSSFLAVLFFAGSIGAVQAQDVTAPAAPSPRINKNSSSDDNVNITTANPVVFMKNIGRDQRDIWTSPFRARVEDLKWIVPLVGLTAGAINADAEVSRRVNPTGTIGKRSSTISNGGLAAMAGTAGGLYLMGKWRSDDHQKETGLLASEAGIDSFIVVEALKAITQRQRPTDGTGQGKFWSSHSLTNSSFPSAHAMVTWSVASVLAHEYPGLTTKVLVYGLATGVSVARVYGKNHFPSDVIAGSTMGWMIGQHVYAAHHDRDLPGGSWGTFQRDPADRGLTSESQFSPYVPIDSWVYPAFDRLVALGVPNSAFQGMRPWTRAECARLLEDVHDEITDDGGSEASRLYTRLAEEFASELQHDETNYLGLDSVYARAMSISGPPLTDGYHFNKTIAYDYGRPYQRGMNYLAGFTSSGSAGALGFYLRGEYEHAPSAPGVSQAVENAILVADSKPLGQMATPIAAYNRPKVLEGYISLNLKGWQASFGKQSLWTGPTADAFAFSNNADGLYMFRVDQTTPKELPGFLRFLGPYRTEIFLGEVSGHHYVNQPHTTVSIGRSLAKQPMMHFEKISFKPTPNFEFGVSTSTMWGGPGIPITLAEVKRTFLTFTNPTAAGSQDPGDRNSYFNWSYRIPGLRNWLTIYQDSFSEDEISPIAYPRRSAQNPGLYLSHLPMLPHMDFRFEGGYTALPNLLQPTQGGFFYWNVGYLDGYTSKGDIIGSTIGREGVSYRASTTYWVAPDKTIKISYRNIQTDKEFLQGGNVKDYRVSSEWSFKHSLSLTSLLQYETWNFPVLAAKPQTNFTASFQLTYSPHWRLKGKSDDY